MRVWPGQPYPLGATWTGLGVNFAIYSAHATKVELCLFDSAQATERIGLHPAARTAPTWCGTATCPTSGPASCTATAFTVRYDPSAGHRFNPHKIVLDPYAKSIGRPVRWDDSMFGYTIGDPTATCRFDTRDNAAFAPLAAVIDPAFTWGDDRPPRTPWHATVIYEMHVKGFSKLQPAAARAAARHLRSADHRSGARAPARGSASRRSN